MLTGQQWQELTREQHRRALMGDSDALKWCAEHAPQTVAPALAGGGLISDAELKAMSDDELRDFIAMQRRIRDAGLDGQKTGDD